MKQLLTALARQSPAMVVALLALFVALGGTAVAAGTLVTGAQIKNSSITGADVKNKSLTSRDFRGSVRGPRGLTGLTGAQGPQGPEGPQGPAGPTGPATGSAGGDLQGSYPNPTIAPGAVTASKLAPEEAWRNVGVSGQPLFANSWANYGGSWEGVGFRKDRDGVVHLRGAGSRAADSGGSMMFMLPSGYRPDQIETFAVASTDGAGHMAPSGGAVSVGSDGTVYILTGSDDRFISLSGISFTATQ